MGFISQNLRRESFNSEISLESQIEESIIKFDAKLRDLYKLKLRNGDKLWRRERGGGGGKRERERET
jgi:hypothetical protein